MARHNATAGQTRMHHGERHYCFRCLNGFASVKSLDNHEECERHPVFFQK